MATKLWAEKQKLIHFYNKNRLKNKVTLTLNYRPRFCTSSNKPVWFIFNKNIFKSIHNDKFFNNQ